MSTVHDIFAKEASRKVFAHKSFTWLSDEPLGYWVSNGKEIPFSILANIMTGGGGFIGAGTAERDGIEGEPTIVPLKDRNKINVETGQRYSAWKYVRALKVKSVPFTPATGAKRFAPFIKKLKELGATVSKLETEEEAYTHAYFFFMDKLKCFNPLKMESFIAEVASAYLMLQHGLRVPTYCLIGRVYDWLEVLKTPRFLTNTATRAESLLR